MLGQWKKVVYYPEIIFTARKRRCGKAVFSEVFVYPQGGLGLCQGGLCLRVLCPGGVSGQGGSLLQGVSVQRGGGLCAEGRGVSVQRGGGLCPGGSLSGRPPYGNEWAVSILLECILVRKGFSSFW